MKKVLLVFLTALIILCAFGCDKKNNPVNEDADTPNTDVVDDINNDDNITSDDKAEYVFPEGTVICGVDVSGKNNNEAYDTVVEAVNKYRLLLTVNGKLITLESSDLELACKKNAVTLYYRELSKGVSVDEPDVLQYNRSAIEDMIKTRFNRTPADAYIRYNSAKGEFVTVSDSEGAEIDIDTVMNTVDNAVLSLCSEAEVTAEIKVLEPDIKVESQAVLNALNEANKYLDISLIYTYAPDNGSKSTEAVAKSTIASFISFDSELNISISSSAINKYVAKMSDKYSVEGQPGNFITTGGYTINVTVTYAGQPVDTAGLYDDIYYCVSNKISGTRVAPYTARTDVGDMSFGGNYIEINMSSQYLWVYKNGTCVVSTPIVTGCAYSGWSTPTGVYSVNDKTPGCYLRGENYTSWVNYWIGFIGNSYGIHDATWRDEFGGDIYLYNGSHGCVNVPYGAAQSIYNNVSIGTKVILYGGATNAEPVKQVIKGTTEYTVASDSSDFKLDAALEYDVTQLKYKSDNPAVVKVSDNGVVTVVGTGTANITVSAEKAEYYTDAQLTVKITVTSACSEGRHKFGEWTQTKAPTCAPGEETHKCTLCEKTETREIAPVSEHIHGDEQTTDPTCTSDGEITVYCTVCGAKISTTVLPATGHSYESGGEYCDHGCGTLNPDYAAPDTGDGNEGESGKGEESGDGGVSESGDE